MRRHGGGLGLLTSWAALVPTLAAVPADGPPPARNLVFFVGDGMGRATVTATRIFSVGVDGQLVLDRFPFTALSRTATADHVNPDSAGTMTAMMTGTRGNSGVVGLDASTERGDFLGDGDGAALVTLVELAKQAGMAVGVVTTARATHATPAATFAHINDRTRENEIALQALPTDPAYNPALGSGLDLWLGGGRRHFLPDTQVDEEGDLGLRSDGRNLVQEFQDAGYQYVWNRTLLEAVGVSDLPLLGLFESGHMEYEFERPGDLGGEPSLEEMATRAVALLEQATATEPRGYLLVVESGRIDHAHHAGNAWRALIETEAFDRAIGTVALQVDLAETLLVATADHGHALTLTGPSMRPVDELAYTPTAMSPDYLDSPHHHVLDVVFGLDVTGTVRPLADVDGAQYTALSYVNGPGHRRGMPRIDPGMDPFPGYGGVIPSGPDDPAYRQEALVPLDSATHAAEDVTFYAVGPGSSQVRGTMMNTDIFGLMRAALGL